MSSYPQNEDPARRGFGEESVDPTSGLVGTPAGSPDLAGPDRLDPSGDDRGMGEKLRDAADELGGKVKEGFGELTDNERLAAEGRQQQADADRRQGDLPR
ncbi:MAG: CsbD family protein [Actinomycetes bacterium]